MTFIMEEKKLVKFIFLKSLKHATVVKSILRKGTWVHTVHAKNTVFEKLCLQRWTKEIFHIAKIFITHPITYELVDMNGEKITGKIYKELQTV